MKPAYLRGRNWAPRYTENYRQFRKEIEIYVVEVWREGITSDSLHVVNNEMRDYFIEKYKEKIFIEIDEWVKGEPGVYVIKTWRQAKEEFLKRGIYEASVYARY